MAGGGLVKNTIIYALGDIVPRALGLITFPILTSYLAPHDYGILSYVSAITGVLSLLGLMCLSTYYLVYYFRVGDEYEKRKLLGNLSIFVIGSNLILTVIFFLVGSYITDAFQTEVSFYPYIAIAVLTNLFTLLTTFPSALYRVQERPLPLVILNISKAVITAMITILLVVFCGYKALGVLYSTLGVSILFGVIFTWITLKNMEWVIDWRQIKQALTFSLPLLPGALSVFAVQMSDRIFIERYLDLSILGIYSTASTVAMLLYIVYYGAYKAFEPYFFKIYDTPEFPARFKSVFSLYIVVLLVGAMGLSMYGKEFFYSFASSQYQQAYIYVPMVQVSVFFSGVSLIFGTIVTAQNKTKLNSVASISAGVVSVVANNILLPSIGIVGACISSALAMGTLMMMNICFCKIKFDYWRPIVAFGVAAMAVAIVVYFININNIFVSILFKAGVLIVTGLIIMFIMHLSPNKVMAYLKH